MVSWVERDRLPAFDFEAELRAKDKEEAPPKFYKPARPPPEGYQESRAEFGSPRSSARKTDPSMTEREKSDLEKYFSETLSIFHFLRERRIPMDLVKIVMESGEVADLDEAKFRLLAGPNRASTGLGYARLMGRFLSWRQSRSDLDGRTGFPDQRMGVLDFVLYPH